MRALFFTLILSACANNSAPTGDQIGRQLRAITHQPRRSFSSPGDFTAMAPSPDSGGAIDGDPACDNASCLPR
jgi:hypothetical protein